MSYFLPGEPHAENFSTAKGNHFPVPGSEEEIIRFKQLQLNFTAQFKNVFPENLASKAVIIIPSLTLDQDILSRIEGINYYEERLLCLLMLLKMPRTHVIYVTSTIVDPVIIDYYLHLLPGITGYHARQRLTLLSCSDISRKSLIEKILERPLLIERIRNSIPSGYTAHIACFNVTDKERTLAVRLGLPIYGCDPDLWYWGTKSGSRILFHKAGISFPPGFENLANENEIIDGLVALKRQQPGLKKAIIKMNDGFSGEGNAVFSFDEAPDPGELKSWVAQNLKYMRIIAPNLNYRTFMKKFTRMQGIVEASIDGEIKVSPSVQCRINPLGGIDIISTHDQLLGGDSGQVFLGANFPASPEYAVEIGQMTRQIAEEMRKEGVLGRFSVDFVSVKDNDRWRHYAIEINLRKGGTTHPYLMLQFLTGGSYHAERGEFEMPDQKKRYYFASDNFSSEKCKGLTPHDLVDIAICNDIHYNSTKEEGVMFHLIGALSQYGKLGLVCIGDSPEKAIVLYKRAAEILENGTGKNATTGQVQPSASHILPGLQVL
ncbi:MAG: peptide ligase PGM1-related protein [Bacteroidota bacterium]|nr:peptide ligase PGM1-related protein [Bacteroidota bacterium]